jgi:hypothetical protein
MTTPTTYTVSEDGRSIEFSKPADGSFTIGGETVHFTGVNRIMLR